MPSARSFARGRPSQLHGPYAADHCSGCCSPVRSQWEFVGRSRKLAYGWTTLDEVELGPFRCIDGIGVIKAGGGAAFVLARCVGVPEELPAGCAHRDTGCRLRSRRRTLAAPTDDRIVIVPVDGGAADPVDAPRAVATSASPGGQTSRVQRQVAGKPIWVQLARRATGQRLTRGKSPRLVDALAGRAFVRDGQVHRIRPDGR